jgi:SAM-dependent methyltransferase
MNSDAVDLNAELTECLRDLEMNRRRKTARSALAAGAAIETVCPELHVAFTAVPYSFILRYVRETLRPLPQRILDLSCGTGWGTGYLKRSLGSEVSVTGADIAISLVDQAARIRAPSVPAFLAGDSRALSFTPESFDLVVSVLGILHNMASADARLCLREISRVLRPGGTLVFTTPNRAFSQELYHPNPADDPSLRFSALNLHEYSREELERLGREMIGDGVFAEFTVGGLSNPVFREVWTELVSKLGGKRFSGGRRGEIASAILRGVLAASARTRLFLKSVRGACWKRGVSAADIARSARYHPEAEGADADHFIVIARRAG